MATEFVNGTLGRVEEIVVDESNEEIVKAIRFRPDGSKNVLTIPRRVGMEAWVMSDFSGWHWEACSVGQREALCNVCLPDACAREALHRHTV